MRALTAVQRQVLHALSVFRFLTHSQMRELRIAHAGYLRRVTTQLRLFPSSAQPFLRSLISPLWGHMEYLHVLTPAGAVHLGVVAAAADWPSLSEGNGGVYRDYWHRKYCVDWHIRLHSRMQSHPSIQLDRVKRYYVPQKQISTGKSQAETRISLPSGAEIEPDMLLFFQARQRTTQGVFVVEMVNGLHVQRVIRQIQNYLHASCVYSRDRLKRVPVVGILVLFARASMLRNVLRRAQRVNDRSLENVFLATLADTKERPLTCWKRIYQSGSFDFLTGRQVGA